MKNNTFLSKNVNEIPFESEVILDPSGFFVPREAAIEGMFASEDALRSKPPHSKTRGQLVRTDLIL